MYYALFVYDTPGSWDDLSTEERRARHDDYHAVGAEPAVIAHYRLRPPQHVRTVHVENQQTVTNEGPLADSRASLRAIYLVDSDNPDSVLDLASRIPAARAGGVVEVWPMMEP
jgi:hypothetical protein